MALNSKKIPAPTGDRVQQPLIAKGTHFARIAQVIDLGLQARKAWKGVEKAPVHQLWVTYELPNVLMLDKDGKEEEGRPRWVSERMNLFSLSQENATSTKRMEALDSDGSIDGDWGRVGGLPCTLTIVHDKTNTYSNVGAVSPPMAGVVIPDLEKAPVIFDIDNPDLEIYNDLPQFLQEIITGNLEYSGSVLQQKLEGKLPPPPPTKEGVNEDDVPY